MAGRTAKAADQESAPTADKKRAMMEASKAKAKAYKESLKRKSTGAAGSSSSAASDAKPPSSKKPRKQAKTLKDKKAEEIQASRKRAKKFAKTLPNGGGGEGGSDDSSGDDSDDMDTSDVDMPTPSRPSPAATVPSRFRPGVSSRFQPSPPMPETLPSGRRPEGRRTHEHQPSLDGVGSPPSPSPYSQGANGGSGRRADQAQDASRRPSSFLRYANEDTDPKPAVSNGSRVDSGAASAGAAAGSGRRPGRNSFVRRVTRITGQQEDHVDVDTTPASTAASGRHGENPSDDGWRQGRAKIWALTCTVALAPVILLCVVSGVLLAWPHMQLAAGGAWGALRGLAANNPIEQKCFVSPSEHEHGHAAVCKEGTEVTVCPDQATCGAGGILHCRFPFTTAKDRSACVLTAEVEEEAETVVEALRILTIEQLCQGNGFIMPSPKASDDRSYITLSDAATAQKRGPLSFLAGMPPGDVAGLIDLDGKAAQEFGGGEGGDGVKPNAGSGSERKARLSKSTYDAVMLTPGWRCRARLAAGSWVLAYWQYCLCVYALVLMVGCLDLRRLKSYKTRVQVCTMRNECYQALLDHAATDPSPMQVSHIQSSVGVRKRARGEGSPATIQQDVRKLWPLVEKEVEHDTRIQRNYKNVLGQRNVACWKWVGPAGIKFESGVPALLPGPAPRLWLLRWLNQPRPTP